MSFPTLTQRMRVSIFAVTIAALAAYPQAARAGIPPHWFLPKLECPDGTKVLANGWLGRYGRTCVYDTVVAAVIQRYVNADTGFQTAWRRHASQQRQLALSAADDKVLYQMMRELVAWIDNRHVVFLDPAQTAHQNEALKGRSTLPRIGATIAQVKAGVLVTGTITDGAAVEAGLARGDVIKSIDGRTCDVNCVARQQRPFSAEVQRGTEVFTLDLVPGFVQGAPSISYGRLVGASGYGILTIPELATARVAADAKEALKQLLRGPALSGLIIDVRHNPGGTAEQLEGVLANFVKTGEYGYHLDKTGHANHRRIRANKIQEKLEQVPIYVLIDAETRSAAELFASILQDSGRAVIVGGPSAGVAEKVNLFSLPDGSRLILATAEYYSPAGRKLSGAGVQPDLRVDRNWWSESRDPHIDALLDSLDRPSPQR